MTRSCNYVVMVVLALVIGFFVENNFKVINHVKLCCPYAQQSKSCDCCKEGCECGDCGCKKCVCKKCDCCEACSGQNKCVDGKCSVKAK